VVLPEALADIVMRVRPTVPAVMSGTKWYGFPVRALNAETANSYVRRITWRPAAYNARQVLQPLPIGRIGQATSVGLGMLHPISDASWRIRSINSVISAVDKSAVDRTRGSSFTSPSAFRRNRSFSAVFISSAS